MENITVENCNRISRSLSVNNDPQSLKSCSQCWSTVFDFCMQKGMEIYNKRTGIEDVVYFIEQLSNKNETSEK